MSKSATTWFCVADSRRARLLQGRVNRSDRLHVVEQGRLEFEFLESEHGRPSPRISKDGHSYASRPHENEQKIAQFARDVARFLQQKVGQLSGQKLVLFAPARFLGALRKAMPARLAAQLDEREGELAHLNEVRLAAHPEVARLLKQQV